jgi:hypothetical protein
LSKLKGKMMYVPIPIILQLDRLKQMNKSIQNPWELLAQNAQVGLELETNFGWLFKKRKL